MFKSISAKIIQESEKDNFVDTFCPENHRKWLRHILGHFLSMMCVIWSEDTGGVGTASVI